MVTESFGQLIITCLLIVRFQWLIEKDYKSFGLDFKTYIIFTMTVSFLTMIHAIYKYHNRHRRSLRPMASLATPILLVTWSMLITTKVFVYVICFINTPGLFFVPVLIKMGVSFLLFQLLVGDFREKRNHEKFVYLLISFMVPASLPSKQFKSMRKLYIINFALYFVECTGVLVFAAIMKYFYHNTLYCTFYEELPVLIFGGSSIVTSFDAMLLQIFGIVVFVTLASSLLIYLYSRCLHPRTRLFEKNSESEKFFSSTDVVDVSPDAVKILDNQDVELDGNKTIDSNDDGDDDNGCLTDKKISNCVPALLQKESIGEEATDETLKVLNGHKLDGKSSLIQDKSSVTWKVECMIKPLVTDHIHYSVVPLENRPQTLGLSPGTTPSHPEMPELLKLQEIVDIQNMRIMKLETQVGEAANQNASRPSLEYDSASTILTSKLDETLHLILNKLDRINTSSTITINNTNNGLQSGNPLQSSQTDLMNSKKATRKVGSVKKKGNECKIQTSGGGGERVDELRKFFEPREEKQKKLMNIAGIVRKQELNK